MTKQEIKKLKPLLKSIIRYNDDRYSFRSNVWDHCERCLELLAKIYSPFNHFGLTIGFDDYIDIINMLWVHDIGEYSIGDIDAMRTKSEEYKKSEIANGLYMLANLPIRYSRLYLEFEECGTEVAKIAHFIDKLEGTMYFFQHQKNIKPEEWDMSMKRVLNAGMQVDSRLFQSGMKLLLEKLNK